jgi:hypothetical protein
VNVTAASERNQQMTEVDATSATWGGGELNEVGRPPRRNARKHGLVLAQEPLRFVNLC